MTAPVAAALDAPWLKEGAVARLLALLNRDGEEARVVGGAVRNTLLWLPVAEVDVATTALPEEVMRRVQAAGGKAVPTGIEHGTITAIVDHHPVEVTTLREDVETFGRKARVVFGRDWKADAERRDFTINALSAGLDGKVHDYVGGLADIAAQRVRGGGSRRTTCASCASSASMRISARARLIRPACTPASSPAPALRRCRASACA
jgi:poly(A) polymerase